MIRYIHGSEDSLDLDVFYVFDELPSFKDCQEFCSNKEENRNIIVVKDGIVANCFKGTNDEINNGILVTYHLHKQDFPLIVERKAERDILMKAIRVVRCLLSHASRTKYRSEVKEALKSHSWNKRIETLKAIHFSEIDDFRKSGTKEDVYKVFAFQLGQILGLFKGVELYTKSSVAKEFPTLKKYLYREKNADFTELNIMLAIFLSKIEDYKTSEENGVTIFYDFGRKVDLKLEKYL